ncbi:MAG: hypothetical protein PHO91_01585 [Patescibacteria group bacterium]|nr:hypothetical protein [Patescibacteria group bacterium]
MFFKNKQKIEWVRGEKTPVNKFLSAVGDTCGITEQVVFARRQKSVNLNDTIWSICNEYILKNMQSGNTRNIRALYYQMERILESEGKKSNKTTQKRLYYDLLEYKKSGCSIVIITCTDDCCDACKKLDGKEYNIDEAIQKQPLPPENCTCPRCCCTY